MKTLIVIFLLFSLNSFAGVSVKSCTGDIRYCDEFGICTDDYFYLYSYQVTKIVDGDLRSVRSRLRLRGSIGATEDYKSTLEVFEGRVVYLGKDFDLAIPIRSLDSVLYRNKNLAWEELCH